MAQKSVYLSWLICKFISHELSIFPPVSDHDLASSKNACDITLKHVLLPKLNLWQNQAKELYQFLFRVFRYHKFTGSFVILNLTSKKISSHNNIRPILSICFRP